MLEFDTYTSLVISSDKRLESHDMSDIYVRRRHGLDYDDAHMMMDKLAEELAEKLNISYEKNGDTLSFRRTGADGTINLSDSEIVIEANLGMMLRMMKPTIVAAIENTLDDYMRFEQDSRA